MRSLNITKVKGRNLYTYGHVCEFGDFHSVGSTTLKKEALKKQTQLPLNFNCDIPWIHRYKKEEQIPLFSF